MSNIHFAVLKNESQDDHTPWVRSIEEHNFSYEIIDLTRSGWLEKVMNSSADVFLARPPGISFLYKNLYDERLFIISNVLNKKIYPSYIENFFYENKRLLSYWLKSKGIPHPATSVFYYPSEAFEYIEKTTFPIVAKTIVGAGGSGVTIIKNPDQAKSHIDKAFSKQGVSRSWVPNLRKGDLMARFYTRLINPAKTYAYLKNKKEAVEKGNESGFILFQEYIPISYEWRCVRIGDSFFGHKKLRSFGEKMSGTSKVGWDIPDETLLNFMKDVTDKGNLFSQALDIFEQSPGKYLVNELQCFWGSKNPHQMINNGIPGRFTFQDGSWKFEPGDFTLNNSFNLRLQHVIDLYQQNKL